jgi:eukaryotic-like serine/threonine-protein kinase
MSHAEFLSTVDGFRVIESEELENIAENIQERTFHAGDYLIRKGDRGDNMYVLVEGKVRVPIFDESGSEKLVFHLGRGDLVGEMALLTGDPRSADVIAESEVKCLDFAGATLQPLLAEFPSLARFLTEILGKRLEEDGGIQQVGKYRLFGKIGEGNTGKVYKALHPGLNRVVAVKMLSHSLSYNRKFRDRFLEEARTVASLAHPNIVNVFDTESAYATYFIVMEKLTGTDLASLLEKQQPIAPGQAGSILQQTASALAYAHDRGFAHRDVKPANITIDEAGTVKLVDFGIAQPIRTSLEKSRPETVDGTPHYIAPETAVGKPTDGRVDIYALGVVAFEMLTGRLPFESNDVMELLKAHVRTPPPDIGKLKPELPEGLKVFVREALEKDPAKRISDWSQIQRLLDPGGSLPAIWSSAREEILSIRFLPSARERVEDAIQVLHETLGEANGVRVTRGSLKPLRGDDNE